MRRATAVLVLAVMLAIGGPAAAVAAHEPSHEFRKVRVAPAMAVYEWKTAGDLSPTKVRQRLRFLRANGFSTVYLEIGNYLEAAELEDEGLLRGIRRQMQRFVGTATGYGLSVQALGGGPDWFGDDRRYLGQLLVELVGSYNTKVAYKERFQGVHLDLEPYTLPGWLDEEHVEENLVEYLTTIEGIVGTYRSELDRWANRGLQLGFAIPFWLDGRGDAPGPVSFGDETKPAAYHVIDLIGDLRGAYLVVMSYRDFTRTSDGSIAHARDEFRYAASIGARSGLIVGQQYGPAPGEEHITFHGQPRWVFRRAAAEIAVAFRRYPQFRGLAVDDIDAFMAADP
ncbi:MAG TPA: hypothetical protein VH016_03290 [Actinomycetota bacterium]|nr:hypothetical protein [Actinomycetota bacterium]